MHLVSTDTPQRGTRLGDLARMLFLAALACACLWKGDASALSTAPSLGAGSECTVVLDNGLKAPGKKYGDLCCTDWTSPPLCKPLDNSSGLYFGM